MANTHFFTFELDSLQYDNANDNLVYQGASAPAGFWSKVKADGGDIRVFHDSSDTAVACEVVHIDTGANELELHFDATDGTAGQSEVWRIEYGDGTLTQPAVGDTLGRNNVWTGPTGSYEGVWHLQEDPSGTAPQMIDSTGNGNNGTTQGSMVSGDSVAGKLAGNALRFETSKNQYVKCGNAFSAPTSFAQSAWIHPEGTGFLGIGGQWDGNDGFLMRMENDPGDDMRNWVDGANNGGSNVAFTRSAWNHAAHVWDGTTQYSYQAGSETDTDAVSSITAETGVDFNIGSYADGNVPFEGPIDEYRVMWNVAFSPNWISTEHNNTNDDASFWPTVTAEQEIGGATQTLTADQGSYSLTGQDAGLLYNRVLTAAQGSYTLTGQAAGLNKTYLLTADQGSYTLTGQASTLLYNRVLGASQGSYTLSGQAANLLYNRVFTAGQGSYTLTGQDATLAKLFKLIASQGSYTLTGQDAGLLRSLVMIAAQGSYTLTGQDAALAKIFKLIAGQGSYTVTGQDAGLLRTLLLSANQGTYSLTGQDAGLLRTLVLAAQQGSYTITGQSATLTVTISGATPDTISLVSEMFPTINKDSDMNITVNKDSDIVITLNLDSEI